MDNILFQYAIDSYGEDVAYLMENAFNQFDEYGLIDYENSFFNILMNNSYKDPSSTHDEFYATILSFQDEIFLEHGIVIREGTRLRDRVELLDSIKILQSLIDYTEAMDILESDEEELEKFALLVEMTSILKTVDVYDAIEEFNPELIYTLRTLILKQMELTDDDYGDDVLKRKIVENAKKFNKFMKGKVTCGVGMMEQGLLLGEEYIKYIPYIEPFLKSENIDSLTETLYSTIILSSDGFLNPILTFKKIVPDLPIDQTILNKVESSFNRFASEYETYKTGTTAFQ